MLPEERKNRICELVNERKSIRVSEISRLLNISEVTARRDLDDLDSQGKVNRTHGGAVAVYSVGLPVQAKDLMASNIKEKRQIAVLAYDQIKDNDTVLVDNSSTVTELVRLIAAGNRKDLIIVTASFEALTILSQSNNHKVIVVGGEANFEHGVFEGRIATEFIKGLRADKAFMGINGIDEEFGYSTPRFEDAEIKKSLIDSSIQSFMLADKTKFGKTYLASVKASCDFIITDKRRDGYNYDWLETCGTILFASENGARPVK